MFIYCHTRNYSTLGLLTAPHDFESSPPQRFVLLPKPLPQTISPTARKPPKILLPEHFMAVSAQIVYAGDTADIPMVARVSLADYRGNVVLDTLVRPTYVAETLTFSFDLIEDIGNGNFPRTSRQKVRMLAYMGILRV